MFFYLSKLLWIVSAPSNVITGLIVLGLILMRSRFRTAGWRMVNAAAALLLLIGVLPLGHALFFVLENRFPVVARAGLNPTGIIVLGGAIDDAVSRSRGQVSLDEAGERMTEAVTLARLYPDAKLVFTGGSNSLFEKRGTEADQALLLWAQLGVEKSRVLLEDKSRNTFENAVFTRALVNPQPGEQWLLVTSAWHMPRSVGLFRKAQFPVTPYPVDFHTEASPARLLRPTFDIAWGLSRFDGGLREWVGLAAYWMTGKTDALFPGP